MSTEEILHNMDHLKELFDSKIISSKEEFKIFVMLLSDDNEICNLASNIIEEKLKELI